MRLSEISFSNILLFNSGRFVFISEQDFIEYNADDEQLKEDVASLAQAIAQTRQENEQARSFSVAVENYNYNVVCIERSKPEDTIFTITKGEPIIQLPENAPVSLNNLKFSDILLHNGEGTYMRGLQGFDRQVLSPPEEVHGEIEELRDIVNAEFEKHHRRSFRIEFKERSYRVSVFDGVASGNGHAFSLRKGVDAVPDLETLGIPKVLTDWLINPRQKKGLILFSGAQASGKTTSAASFIKKRLEEFGGHGLSIEMPAEMPLGGKHGESGSCWQCDLESEEELKPVLQVSHRSTADIIFIGEVLGRITASELLRISLSSNRQIIVSTIHGTSICAALDRLLTWAREELGEAAALNLSDSLLAVIHQELVPSDDKKSWKVTTPEFLLLSDKSQNIRSVIRKNDHSALQDIILEQENNVMFSKSTEDI
ncbi:ATPase, T2SS/T4P/T4SS family [Halodesulfovibrio sp.]|jgi:twitching motility protein PilT|uniref:ATPase, T2SS/T4P/T4SS family n=1 Tax=Halodesulfovibrio sp. TaxID=1912772 RepID=UPI0025F14222|nr:ATPase, T2SS/T4P/T4SS family [Halodesulfovibrio sp.]MCT4625663.1 ATPase, T2SS/T4P/T4SS family [Halodesulfovibrio sp.]